MQFTFGDIVVVNHNQIGVVVKCWAGYKEGKRRNLYEVYVRNQNCIQDFDEKHIQRYMVRHKELDENEMQWQKNATKA